MSSRTFTTLLLLGCVILTGFRVFDPTGYWARAAAAQLAGVRLPLGWEPIAALTFCAALMLACVVYLVTERRG